MNGRCPAPTAAKSADAVANSAKTASSGKARIPKTPNAIAWLDLEPLTLTLLDD